jgi:hypothetical protein
MKSLIKNIANSKAGRLLKIKYLANSKLSIILRNTIKIGAVNIKFYENNKAVSTVSDIFLWRTDNGFKTKFKFSDILKMFYEVEGSWVEIHFYTKNNKLIKIQKIDSLNHVNEIDITSEYLGNVKDYGNFYIFHFCSKKSKILIDDNILSNRCYVGYSKDNNLESFMHGNAYAKFTSVYNDETIRTDIVRTSFFKNSEYTIQKYFDEFDRSELFISNPTSKILKFSINNKDYNLNPSCVMNLDVEKPIVTIKSNCMFLRPTVFSYKNEYLDVHHS